MLGAATRFLEEEFLPRIEKRGTEKHPVHEAGWSLSYHGSTRAGRLVRASKYEDAGPFALNLVARALEIVRTRYPLAAINGIVSVPPTRSGMLHVARGRTNVDASRSKSSLSIDYYTNCPLG